jgi:hypothetical protein
MIFDTGATTEYLGEEAAKLAGAEIVPIAPRKIRVADKQLVTCNSIAKVEMKLGSLSPELITAYVLPMSKIDLILGLPWLRKHNPHVDFHNMSFEFTKNGRKYTIYPAEADRTSKLRIVDYDEFANYVDDSTELFLIRPALLVVDEVELEGGEKGEVMCRNSGRMSKPMGWIQRLKGWIERNCPRLLRAFGTPAKIEPFDIDTREAEPIRISPRPHSPLDLQKIREFLDKNLKNGVISESISPWSAPLVLATKPNGRTRVCVDYRALNRITKKNAHPLPRIDESFTLLYGAVYFSSLDLKSGYWQRPLTFLSKEKTAFGTRYGHYQWNVMPFGLIGAPGSFQHRLNKVLALFLNKFVIVYLDNILIFSTTKEEHEEHIKQVFTALEEAGMILNREKCKFFQEEVKFLGHRVSKEGFRPDPSLVQKINEYPVPRNITDVRGFINLAEFYKRYIEDFAHIFLPLTDLMAGSPKPGTPITRTEKHQDAFELLKSRMSQYPCTTHVQPGTTFYISTDSSDRCIGGELQQYVDDADGKKRLHPIAFESKKLSKIEQRYSAQEREMLAIKHGLSHWRHIVEGAEIIVFTDHESLKGFRTQKHMTKRLGRFMGEIEHFDPLIVYRPGKEQVVADALSRMPGAREDGEPADKELFWVDDDDMDDDDEEEDEDDDEREETPELIDDSVHVHEPDKEPDWYSAVDVMDAYWEIPLETREDIRFSDVQYGWCAAEREENTAAFYRTMARFLVIVDDIEGVELVGVQEVSGDYELQDGKPWKRGEGAGNAGKMQVLYVAKDVEEMTKRCTRIWDTMGRQRRWKR